MENTNRFLVISKSSLVLFTAVITCKFDIACSSFGIVTDFCHGSFIPFEIWVETAGPTHICEWVIGGKCWFGSLDLANEIVDVVAIRTATRG